MKHKILILALGIYLIFCFPNLYGKNMLVNQKKGLWQDQEGKQVKLFDFKKINFNFDQVPLKKVEKILLHMGRIFILDGYRNEIYIIDKTGKYLYTIGRPGQGPGDLEYPYDMFISDDDKIYVLNALPRRVEIFNIEGKPLGTVKLDNPDHSQLPRAILVDGKKDFIIGSSLNHLIAIYDSSGNYRGTILKPQLKAENSTEKFGVVTKLAFNKNKRILHFDEFEGIFTLISTTGKIETVFNVYDRLSDKKIRTIKQGFTQKNGPSKPGSLSLFSLWTNFCTDDQGRIYVIPLSRTVEEYQKLFVFSENGKFLYSRPLVFFQKMHVLNIICDSDSFVFRTHDFDLFIANRRIK